MNSNAIPDELSRVMLKIRQRDRYSVPASSSVTLERIVDTLASEREEWKAKAKEIERQLDQLTKENEELKLALEKERETLKNCTADYQSEIGKIVEKKNEQIEEVLGYLSVYKSQLMSVLDITDESYESMDSHHLMPLNNNDSLKTSTQIAEINDCARQGARVANLLGFHRLKLTELRRSWRL